MKTVAQQTLDKILESRLLANPRYADVLGGTLKGMNGYEFSYINVFGQKYGKFTVTDAMIFNELQAYLQNGYMMLARIKAGRCYVDREKSKNNTRLSRLPEPFFGEFTGEKGGGADNDGALWWTKDIKVNMSFPKRTIEKTLTPGQCPIEVGTTAFEKTKYHLFRGGVLARWPYRDEYITLIYLDLDLILLPELEPDSEEESRPIYVTPRYEPVVPLIKKQLVYTKPIEKQVAYTKEEWANAVALQRYADHTGETPRLIED